MLNVKSKLVIGNIHGNGAARLACTVEEHTGNLVLNCTLQRAAEWPSPVIGVPANLQDSVLGGCRKLHADALLGHALPKIGRHQVHDLAQLRLGKRVENNDLVHPVEKLGPKSLTQLGQ